LAEDVQDGKGEVLFKKGHLVGKNDAKQIEDLNVKSVAVRSPLTCKTTYGICAHCYGVDLGKNAMIDIGEAVGTVAAQAIGEPGTQLTMRTFHSGGVATAGGDITQGLPRVEEVFENRNPKNPAVVSEFDGTVLEVQDLGKEKVIKVLGDKASDKKKSAEKEYVFTYRRMPIVRAGDKVKAGQLMTDGSANIDEVFEYGGKESAQNYIISEINKLYELQGETVSRKHIEVIVRQMFSRSKIKKAGDTEFTEGEIIENSMIHEENEKVKENNGEPAISKPLLMGITEVSLSRRSFLSAASFQHTTRVLIQNAVKGSTDELRGLKENVIIGRLIPAGTGFKGSKKYEMIKNLQAELQKEYASENLSELRDKESLE
jgi:DNA-directed RNA polymerase subunit beta'